jgi:hypothetical protein
MKTKLNKPINDYMSEGLNVPSRDPTDEGSSTMYMVRPNWYQGMCN